MLGGYIASAILSLLLFIEDTHNLIGYLQVSEEIGDEPSILRIIVYIVINIGFFLGACYSITRCVKIYTKEKRNKKDK